MDIVFWYHPPTSKPEDYYTARTTLGFRIRRTRNHGVEKQNKTLQILTAGYVATAFFFVFNTFLAIGFDGIPFLLPVELTPLQTRGKSVATTICFFWLCNFFVVMISPVLIGNIKYGTYILWAGTNLAFIPMIYYLIPETNQGTLEDIDVLFETNPRWLIGPGSKKKLAAIVQSRQEVEASAAHEKRSGKEEEMVESVETKN